MEKIVMAYTNVEQLTRCDALRIVIVIFRVGRWYLDEG